MIFGSGIHHWVGATLARRELSWGFCSILLRCGRLALANTNDFPHALNLRGGAGPLFTSNCSGADQPVRDQVVLHPPSIERQKLVSVQ